MAKDGLLLRLSIPLLERVGFRHELAVLRLAVPSVALAMEDLRVEVDPDHTLGGRLGGGCGGRGGRRLLRVGSRRGSLGRRWGGRRGWPGHNLVLDLVVLR